MLKICNIHGSNKPSTEDFLFIRHRKTCAVLVIVLGVINLETNTSIWNLLKPVYCLTKLDRFSCIFTLQLLEFLTLGASTDVENIISQNMQYLFDWKNLVLIVLDSFTMMPQSSTFKMSVRYLSVLPVNLGMKIYLELHLIGFWWRWITSLDKFVDFFGNSSCSSYTKQLRCLTKIAKYLHLRVFLFHLETVCVKRFHCSWTESIFKTEITQRPLVQAHHVNILQSLCFVSVQATWNSKLKLWKADLCSILYNNTRTRRKQGFYNFTKNIWPFSMIYTSVFNCVKPISFASLLAKQWMFLRGILFWCFDVYVTSAINSDVTIKISHECFAQFATYSISLYWSIA